MEQRSQMLKEMHLSRKESKREIQGVVDLSYRPRSATYKKDPNASTDKEPDNSEGENGGLSVP